MSELLLPTAAGLAFLIGVVHSYLGERYILMRLFRRDLPKLFGSDWFTRRTLRFAWHLLTVACWGFAALLLLLAADPPASRQHLLWAIAAVFAVSGLISGGTTRGRHLSWVVFFAIALLVLVAAR